MFSILPWLMMVDILAEIYHQIGFRLCHMPLIDRSKYIRIDRHRLEHLNIIDKVGCAYCGYANGLVMYLSEIAARTELYWCAIKHQKEAEFMQQEHQQEFLEYGDEEGFREKYL